MKKRKHRSRVEEISANIYGELTDAIPATEKPDMPRAKTFYGICRTDAREAPIAEVHAVYARVLATIAHPRLLSPRELAEISGVSTKDIYRMFRSKRLRGWRVPGRKQIKFTLEELLEAMIPVVNE